MANEEIKEDAYEIAAISAVTVTDDPTFLYKE